MQIKPIKFLLKTEDIEPFRRRPETAIVKSNKQSEEDRLLTEKLKEKL